jgi:hypothetical protein
VITAQDKNIFKRNCLNGNCYLSDKVATSVEGIFTKGTGGKLSITAWQKAQKVNWRLITKHFWLINFLYTLCEIV